MLKKLKAPLAILAELSHRCPLSCAYCSNPIELIQKNKELETDDWLRHIAFREYLKGHPKIKSQYELLKEELSLMDWRDGNEYNEAKDSFIKKEEAKAILWYEKK